MVGPLRDYQKQDIEAMRAAFRSGCREIVYNAFCGAGKTHTTAFMAEGSLRRGKRVLFLAHLRELLSQCADRFKGYGMEPGIIMPGYQPSNSPIQIASKDTLVNRGLPPADLVIIDECHHAASDTYRKLLAQYPEAIKIGLSATPHRLDGKPLDMFKQIVTCSLSPEQLIDRGYLVRPTAYGPSDPDLKDVDLTGGDFNRAQLQKLMDKPKLVGDIVEHWLRHAKGRLTLAYATGISHAQHIASEFRACGVNALEIDSKMAPALRAERMRLFEAGDIEVLVNVGLFIEAIDVPEMSCVIDACQTSSLVRHVQKGARCMRSFPGKTSAIILDHAGNTRRHGYVFAPHEWSLKGRVHATKKTSRDESPAIRLCLACYAYFPSEDDKCPQCGVEPEKKVREIKSIKGELVEITGKDGYRPKDGLSKIPSIREIQKIAIERGYPGSWVRSNVFRIRKGLKPVIPAHERNNNPETGAA